MKLKIFGETIGTGLLIYFGTGLLIFGTPFPDLLGPAIGWGFTLAVLVYVIGPLSGAHLNPVVTLTMYLTKRMSGKEALIFVGSQLLGGLLGELAVVVTYGSLLQHKGQSWQTMVVKNNLGGTVFPNLSPVGAFLTEVLLTTVLLLVILVLNHSRTNMYAIQSPIAVGLTIFVLVIVGGNLTGASMNPIRSFFPAIFAGGLALQSIWLYLLAPFVGVLVAVLINQFVLKPELKINR
ncbi:aquaporin [Fructilactobacillus myrtifloralis]|uniref:Aquaporin n=1 Tax=Fructilactobacillus myrtifloralis TaxID=2940301 RepID=A0ABY5BN97_9LACO|nr:aquaporin [Fructilactobacillus myrtifloralis]USS85040.1 aquaporin [Fructilactobacillus myrtifloralis]